MISEILLDVLAYFLFISFIICFFVGCIYIIIWGTREYLEEADGFYLFAIVVGCIGVMCVTIIVLKVFGL